MTIDIDLSLHVVGRRAGEVVGAAVAAEELGFASVSLSDELCDFSGGGGHSHEPWTLLSAIAARTSRIALGTLVLNVANRDAGTMAVASATLQDLCGGRLWIGLGAGTDRSSVFARDQLAFGRVPPRAPERRAALEAHLAGIRAIWANTTDGFLRPDPPPPLVVGGFGPKTAAVAGRAADGLACPVDGFGDHARPIEDLATVAREAFAAAGRAGELALIAHTGPHDTWREPRFARGAELYDRLAAVGAGRLTLFCEPDPAEIEQAARFLPVG
ncbi:LLM class flavin-dependent oxidoreductase [Pseudonocardia acaciae]|uniref:LLM class flavin-dependent oxidoreductase n=1 Tax=Pseudonocardia acaciae TaxID=551276 RepID=UPI000491D199|nr:LLM class flavin-dependent oxidoreductase [Pseudonocardia acaciae]